jgi:predicted dehydrogenase
MPGVRVPALCDYKAEPLYRAKRWVESAGQSAPSLYGRGKTDYERLCAEEDLDAMICSTSWESHAPICLAGMRNDMHVVSEVPLVQTVEEGWEILETWKETGYWAALGLEQVLLRGSLAMLNMVQQGVLGEILHARGGYVHDLRRVKFDPEEEPWRLQYSITENGNLYPDHPMNRILPTLGINHGDRFDHLVSMSSKAMMLNQYAEEYYGEEHPHATAEMDQGDVNATLLRTVNGKMATLNFDTNTPHPREMFRVQGSEGVYTAGSLGRHIYLEGKSSEHHEWEPAEPYLNEHEHPLRRNYDPPPRKDIRGHGGADYTPITWHLLVKALREDTMPYIDVYDSVTSSAIVPLSKKSVAKGSQPVAFPDFTGGEWKTRAPFLEGVEVAPRSQADAGAADPGGR